MAKQPLNVSRIARIFVVLCLLLTTSGSIYFFSDSLLGLFEHLLLIWQGLVVVFGGPILLYGLIWPAFDSKYLRRVKKAKILTAAMACSFILMLVPWFALTGGHFRADYLTTYPPVLFVIAMPAISYVLVCSAVKAFWGKKYRDQILPGFAVLLLLACLGGLTYHTHISPRIRQIELFFDPSSTDEQIRQNSAQLLKVRPWDHDGQLNLVWIGQRSDVPILIDAIRWSDLHGSQALEAITNNVPGELVDTAERWSNPEKNARQWQEWYDEHGHKSREEWIAMGFRSRGIHVTTRGTHQDIKAILALLGSSAETSALYLYTRVPNESPRNPIFLLDSYNPNQLQTSFEKILQAGSVAERRGLAVYAQKPCLFAYWGYCRGDEPINSSLLDALSRDQDRTVRAWAQRGLAVAHIRNSERQNSAPSRAEIEEHDINVYLDREATRRGDITLSFHAPPENIDPPLHTLRARSTRTGDILYEREIFLGFVSATSVSLTQNHRGQAFFASNDVTVALDIESGRILWQRPIGGTIAFIDGRLAFAPSSRSLESTFLIDPETGQFLN